MMVDFCLSVVYVFMCVYVCVFIYLFFVLFYHFGLCPSGYIFMHTYIYKVIIKVQLYNNVVQ